MKMMKKSGKLHYQNERSMHNTDMKKVVTHFQEKSYQANAG